MSDTSKAKGLFFASYLGQQVMILDCIKFPVCEPKELKPYMFEGEFMEIKAANGYLLLRSIEQLTDEEGFNIDIIWGYGKTANADHGKKLAYWLINNSRSLYPDISFRAFSYLLRIGILLPFTYLNEENKPITLTPEEIIKLGWAKLRTELNIQL